MYLMFTYVENILTLPEKLNSATVEEFVKRGYKVRVSTRDISKTAQFEEKLKKLYGDGLFEAVQIEDYTAPGAYEEALKGEENAFFFNPK